MANNDPLNPDEQQLPPIPGMPTAGATGGTAPPQPVTPASVTAGSPAQQTAAAQGPATVEVTPEMTAEGRLSNILQRGSKYLTQARTQGEQAAQRRGLLASSIAGQAGEAAAIQAAAPIAAQDAAALQRAAEINQAAQQQFATAGLGFAQNQEMLRLQTEAQKGILSQEGQ